MSRKFSPQRRNAFLAALRATGNQTLAAERAGVSLSWCGCTGRTIKRSTAPC